MPPEASGPVFTVRNPIFIGPLWARRIAGAATSALAPSMPFNTVRRWTVMAPPFGLDLCGWVSPIARFLIKLDIILTYRNQFCPARRAPSAARRRLISCKDCDVSCRISSPVASPMTPSDSQVPGFDLVVGSKLFRTRGIDHLALTHHVHVIDQLERERGVLFDQQNRMAFLLQPRDRLPQPLDDDGREPLGRLVHDQAVRIGHEPAADGQHLLLAARERPGALAASFAERGLAAWLGFAGGRGNSAWTRSMFQPRRSRLRSATMRFSSTLSVGNTRRPCGTRPIPLRTVSNEETAVISTPLNSTFPRRGRLKPTIEFTNVVLPTPLRPSSPRICPCSSFKDRPWRT